MPDPILPAPKHPDYTHCTSWEERVAAGQRHAQTVSAYYAAKGDERRKQELLAFAACAADPFARWEALFDAGVLARGGGMPTPQPTPTIRHSHMRLISFEQAFTRAPGTRMTNKALMHMAVSG